MFMKRKKLDIAESELSKRTGKFHKKQWLEMSNNYLFALWGLTMHLILLWGVLDVNFHSPIIRGMPIVPAPNGAPAKRLLLFVADGLRFQTFIEKPPPYLRFYGTSFYICLLLKKNNKVLLFYVISFNFI